MVGLVLVSHSQMLAEGAAELALAMAQPGMSIAAAGGSGQAETPLGTNVERILAAIESAYGDEGVLVLMDLGSAILSAEMALEFMPPERRAHVRLCSAPLVEGAVAASVQAGLGSSLDEVAQAALGALAPKQQQLASSGPKAPEESTAPAVPEAGPAAEQAVLAVENPLGLHARPAARFVQTAARFQSAVTVARDTPGAPRANAKSINAVAALGVRQGERLRLSASGPDAREALAALQALAAGGFGEGFGQGGGAAAETLPGGTTPAPAAAGALSGIPASPGIAIGPAVLMRAAPVHFEQHSVKAPEAEWVRLQAAREAARIVLTALRERVARSSGEAQAEIFDAQRLFLDDAELLDAAHALIFSDGATAEYAWDRVVEGAAERLQALQDAYMAARAADVRDVGKQVITQLAGTGRAEPPAESGILVADDLAPSDTARLDRSRVLAICTARGGATSHSAILARVLDIPAVVGLGPQILRLAPGTPLVVDGAGGLVWPQPAPALQAEYARKAHDQRAARAAARAASAAPAVTRDGRRIEMGANAASAAEAQAGLESGAEGIGLLRTEFLFLDRREAPAEDEQAAAYAAILQVMGDRPVIIRTLDVGGDKPLPYLDMPHEDNPFLGQRAIRLCLDRPELFRTQLRAILRAAQRHSVRIMFPMIAEVREVRAARAQLEQARAELEARGVAVRQMPEVGIMVEIPAAALLAARLAPEVDFFSIGTNDLTQYTLASERGNPKLAYLADGLHPAVLREIRATVEAAEAAGHWAGVCGELGGDPQAIPILVGLGVRELSMAPASIPAAKAAIRALDYAAARDLAARALDLESAEAVRALR